MQHEHVTITHRFDQQQFAEFLCVGRELLHQLNHVEHRLENLMAQSQEMRDFLARLNTATNTLAARVQALIDKIEAGGMSAADETAAVAEGNALVATLEAVGADPDNPLPPPVATPTP